MYSTARYVTVTGQHLDWTPATIETRQEQIEKVYKRMFGEEKPAPAKQSHGQHAPSTLTDLELIERACKAGQGAGERFRSLWNGDTTAHASPSEADMALCNYLAFWCGPHPERIDSLFRQSGLFRSKWQRPDYSQRTIKKAIDGCSRFYEPLTNGHRKPSPAKPPAEKLSEAETSESDWPKRPGKLAFHGLAGDYVRMILPHTEASAVGILVQFIASFGSVLGRTAHRVIGGSRHHGNLFVVLVGKTAKGRKGTSWAFTRDFFDKSGVDMLWAQECVHTGLSSGEGLIFAVRDPVIGKDADGNDVIKDPGVTDKRLLVVEEEFASVLRVARRDGNTLSIILRQAWDGCKMGTMTKNSPFKACNPHVTIIGHVSLPDLIRHLGDTDTSNGFANRFLWVAVKRSKLLPDGGVMPDLSSLHARLTAAVAFAQSCREMKRSAAAALWHKVYGTLSRGRPGLLGLVTGRAEAQVSRLAMLYALLDQSDTIEEVHLRAALSLWSYCFRSCEWIFCSQADREDMATLLQALKVSGGKGMNLTEMNKLFHGHKSTAEIQRLLDKLFKKKLVIPGKKAEGGKSAIPWRAAPDPAEVE